MLDLDPKREGTVPKPAATIVWVREGEGGVEVFCVERNKKARFLGGAIVFPGGKLDPADGSPDVRCNTPAVLRDPTFADDVRPFLVAVCRESLEEAALVPLRGAVAHESLLAARAEMAAGKKTFRDWLSEIGETLDVARIHPFSRWITPTVEARRYDTRFFLAVAPEGQPGAHDNEETMASFWATPAVILARFAAGEVQLAPPTHRTLEQLAGQTHVAAVLRIADENPLAPICPELVQTDGTLALVLPGDREHSQAEPKLPGKSRYVLRGEHWRAEDPS